MAGWNEAIEQCETILNLIEEEVPQRAWDTRYEFFESVKEKVGEMAEWIEENKVVTKKMSKALNNMETGVRKWIED